MCEETMKKTRTFYDEVMLTTDAVHEQQRLRKDREEALAYRQSRNRVKQEAPKHLNAIKQRVREAAKRGEHYIDLFPTGLLGDALLELLGPGFRADTDTTRLINIDDGAGGYSDGSYIPHTRLIWTSQSLRK
jgi:hypothetical protein